MTKPYVVQARCKNNIAEYEKGGIYHILMSPLEMGQPIRIEKPHGLSLSVERFGGHFTVQREIRDELEIQSLSFGKVDTGPKKKEKPEAPMSWAEAGVEAPGKVDEGPSTEPSFIA